MKNFLKLVLCGGMTGMAVIVPGVSGGTIAVLLGIYDQLLEAVSGIRKHFVASMKYLLPFALGILLAVAILYYPIKYALQYIPFPTIMLFAGMMLGSLPKLLKDTLNVGKIQWVSMILPLIAVVGICLIPGMGIADLSETMPVWQYFVLILIGMVGACALVIPGVSGSMLLLILGYYEPILNTISLLRTSPLHALIVFALFGVGVVVGFFTIAKLMKWLLEKFPRGTNWAIIGFVFGSIPALFLTETVKTATFDGLQIGLGVAFLIVGTAVTFGLLYFEKRKKEKQQS